MNFEIQSSPPLPLQKHVAQDLNNLIIALLSTSRIQLFLIEREVIAPRHIKWLHHLRCYAQIIATSRAFFLPLWLTLKPQLFKSCKYTLEIKPK